MFKFKKIILSCILTLSLLITSTLSAFAAEDVVPYSTNDKVEIRDYPSGKVWAKGVFYNYDYPNETPFSLSTNVQNGYRLQIFYDISSINNPPGPYRKGKVNWVAEILPSYLPR